MRAIKEDVGFRLNKRTMIGVGIGKKMLCIFLLGDVKGIKKRMDLKVNFPFCWAPKEGSLYFLWSPNVRQPELHMTYLCRS